MTDNAVVLLNQLLEDRQKSGGGPPLPEDEAFELFAFEQALKEDDLSPDELAQGRVGGGQDGGIDGVFCFVNGTLVQEDDEILQDGFEPSKIGRGPELRLVVAQAKRGNSFSETAVQKIERSLEELLDLGKTEEELGKLFSPKLIERFEIFRQTWRELSTRHPRVSVEVVYATKGDTGGINDKVRRRAELLEEKVRKAISGSDVTVTFLGARELYELAGRDKSYTLQLTYAESSTASASHVALVTLTEYFKFITEDTRALRRYIFDWNVRDYAGAVEVNKEIAASLGDADAPEFWWLNNGVTVICSNASAIGKTFSLDDVQIVNGLQTSVSIHNHLKDSGSKSPAAGRSILVRIIVTDDPQTRDRVIRATNRQTRVSDASLRATDDIQRDLERWFEREGWFYERRKNYYKNQGKRADRLVSIPFLAQAVAAIGLSEPDNSRARPSSLLKRDTDYERIFDSSIDYNVYLWAAKTQRAVDEFLRSDAAKASAAERANLRFHVAMVVVAQKYGGPVYNPRQLSSLSSHGFSNDEFKEALKTVRTVLKRYERAHPDIGIERITKSAGFREALVGDLEKLRNRRTKETGGEAKGDDGAKKN